MSIVAAHPALAIWGSIIILLCLSVYALLRLTDERGHHKAPRRPQARQFERDLDDWQWHAAPTIDHEWPALLAAPTPEDTLAPAAPDATPNSGPAAGAREPEPPAGDEAPGPDGAPEGDESAARPPQGTAGPGNLLENAPGAPMVAGEIPARPPLVSAHETAAPGDLLAKAVAAVREQPVSDYLTEVQDGTAYADDGPWNPFSDDTMTRIQAIKAEVAR